MQQHPYAHPHAPVPMGYPPGAHAPGIAPEAVAGAATPALAMIGLRAAVPIIFYFVPLQTFVRFESYDIHRLVRAGIDAFFTLLALIFFWVWFAKAYAWVRANRGGTRFSNGMAIGSWFIPLVQWIVPYMAMRDAWRRAANDENGILVVVWWITYLVAMILGLYDGRILHDTGVSIDVMNLVHKIVYYGGLLAQLTTWCLMAFMVQTLTKRIAAR
jgi:hypothetical protein